MGLQLPVHIVSVIFSKLSVSNLPICRLVCRAWNDLVLNSKFLISKELFLVFSIDFDPINPIPKHEHSKIHCVDIDTLSSVASFEFGTDYLSGTIYCHPCNGLFFISKWKPTICVGISNPITNQFFKLPEFKSDDGDELRSLGFGFSPKTNRYKLFRVIHEGSTSTTRMEVLRFSNTNHDRWSLVSNSMSLADYKFDGVYLNGFIYWMVKKEDARNEFFVNALDVETEEFKSTVVLKLGGFPKSMKFESFNDAIYVTVCINKPPPAIIEVWRMREKDSWVRDFVFDIEEFDYCKAGLVHFVKAFEDGRMLVLIKDAYFCLDKMGRKVKIQPFDLNARLVTSSCYLSFFNFGSLPDILVGHE